MGTFLSPGNKGNELREYAHWCNAVEGNTTFYATPAPATIKRWSELAPASFRFAFKAPRTITHERRLAAGSSALLAEYLRAIAPLHDRCGPIQLQLPPSFGPDSIGALTRFVGGLPDEFSWTVELRHRAFFDGGTAHRAVDEVLGSAGVGRVVLDTRPLYATPAMSEAAVAERAQKPRLPVLTDLVGATPIVRVIGGDDEAGVVAGLRSWVPVAAGWLAEGRQPYVFAHQPDNRRSPALARSFHAMLASEVDDLAPLPEPHPVAPASEIIGQASLF
ncbi:MAG: DUF72 domain-containing protein [Desertimonas sp.]